MHYSNVRFQNFFFFFLPESCVTSLTLVHSMPPHHPGPAYLYNAHTNSWEDAAAREAPIQYKGFIWSIYCKSELQEWNYMITCIRQFAIRHNFCFRNAAKRRGWWIVAGLIICNSHTISSTKALVSMDWIWPSVSFIVDLACQRSQLALSSVE